MDEKMDIEFDEFVIDGERDRVVALEACRIIRSGILRGEHRR